MIAQCKVTHFDQLHQTASHSLECDVCVSPVCVQAAGQSHLSTVWVLTALRTQPLWRLSSACWPTCLTASVSSELRPSLLLRALMAVGTQLIGTLPPPAGLEFGSEPLCVILNTKKERKKDNEILKKVYSLSSVGYSEALKDLITLTSWVML